MDCVDCHNRPTHIYGLPESEVDLAIHAGRIASELPYIRREGVAAIQIDYESHQAAREGIEASILAFYRSEYPDLASSRNEEIQNAADELGNIYSVNVFPKMRVVWGTYPNHIGHESSPGCFRCHTDEHATEAGEVISQDCDTCHSLLAWGEEDPEIMTTLYPE
jgi:formate-dependent nitrite reductase cytochrome c552 subunit